MRKRITILTLLLLLVSMLKADVRSLSTSSAAKPLPERIQFRITTIEEDGRERNIVSDSTVAGAPGTDFDISLQGERFKMNAKFLTDLVAPEHLQVRAWLDTRRLYGYSEKNLPLYEEDNQSQTLDLSFDEMVVLLPFGRDGGENRLKIEITPTVSQQGARLPSGPRRPLEINILKPSPGGVINIQASKIPHRYSVEATLFEDGREVARGASDLLLQEPHELMLRPIEQADAEVVNNPLAVNLLINQYTRSRPADLATVGFDLYRTDQAGAHLEAIGLKWAGVAELGSALSYDLTNVYLKGSGKKFELRFKINLAAGEQAD